MNIDDLTLGQIKQLRALFDGQNTTETHGPPVGSYVIVRSRDAGVHAGVLVAVDYHARVVTLKESRRLWRWWSRFTLSELAQLGVRNDKSSECKFSVTIADEIQIAGWCEILPVTGHARKTIADVANANE